ncbi:uncharacterized protein LOC129754433 [Uranotaenia lowii]|uniref:uncharacterized protein LOC129754433 n=1 Tax=Uranotaenia lowii TaxID=190385 RepID=UPI0024793B00|nr:uncharacterized protein LOC129754433 [Uranotaenia lowii]
MDSPEPTSMDFSTFVLELNHLSPQLASPIEPGGSRHRCPPESRLSEEFESKMQLLLTNFDLDDDDGAGEMAVSADVTILTPTASDESGSGDGAEPHEVERTSSAGSAKHVESLETTVDNEDDPLNLTGGEEEEEDSGDAGDAGSSDEQQQSCSLSLSYSLSISHAQENFSQYSQSTDKGLSKRYDSPCSYEDDRESECTNFDKLDDWNDFISDIHNNNNNNINGNGEGVSRDFREYYDEYLANKGQQGNSSSEEVTSDECSNTKEKDLEDGQPKKADKKLAQQHSGDKLGSRPATPAVFGTTVAEKSQDFFKYRNPEDDEDEPMFDDNSNSLTAIESNGLYELEPGKSSPGRVQQQSSGKRKFCHDDREDIEYEITNVIVEKFHKTGMVPHRGYHDPISRIDDQTFARITQVPRAVENGSTSDEHTDYEEDPGLVTTPTNPRNMQQMFQTISTDPSSNIQFDPSIVQNK